MAIMLENGEEGYSEIDEDTFQVLPIGLTMEQIKKYKLPANPTKLTDSRANGYIKKFGKTCWEVDALNPRTLTEIVETNIQSIIDMKQYRKMLREEADGIAELKSFIEGK